MSLFHTSRSLTYYLLHASLDLFPLSHFFTDHSDAHRYVLIFWTTSLLFLPPSSLFLCGFIRSCRCSFELDGNVKLQSQMGVHCCTSGVRRKSFHVWSGFIATPVKLEFYFCPLCWLVSSPFKWLFRSSISHSLLICFLLTKRLINFFLCLILS